MAYLELSPYHQSVDMIHKFGFSVPMDLLGEMFMDMQEKYNERSKTYQQLDRLSDFIREHKHYNRPDIRWQQNSASDVRCMQMEMRSISEKAKKLFRKRPEQTRAQSDELRCILEKLFFTIDTTLSIMEGWVQ